MHSRIVDRYNSRDVARSLTKGQECTLCGNNSGNEVFCSAEKMYGLGGVFEYLRCSNCGLMELLNPPQLMSDYYPDGQYYSIHNKTQPFKEWLVRARDGSYASDAKITVFLRKWFPNVALEATLATGLNPNSKVLDVGCGNGRLLMSLAQLGFTDLQGVDPLLKQSEKRDGINLISGDITKACGPFDLIMFHHCLEHVPEQVGVLTHARKLLRERGRVLVRIPTCQSLAFEIYGTNWVQLDAPRHIFLHTHRSLHLTAHDAGFQISRLYCDSQPMQFWASDMYRDGLPLTSSRLRLYKRRRAHLYRSFSKFLNLNLFGDQLVAELRPCHSP